MSAPLVSVILPAYNSEKFIAEALDSVFAQIYRPIEVIVIDDGSTDHTADVVRKCEERFTALTAHTGQTSNTDKANKTGKIKLKYLYQSNSGPSAARNIGIRAARGEYIAFLDADDLWPSEKIERQVALMTQHRELCLLFGDMVNFGPEGQEQLGHFKKNVLNAEFFGSPLIVVDAFRKIFHNNFIPTPTVLVRRAVLEQTGGFDEEFRFSEDYLLWLRCARLGAIGYQDEVLMLRRKHADNLTRDTTMNVFIRPKVLAQIEKEHGEHLRALGISLRKRYAEVFFQMGYYRLYTLEETDVVRDFVASFRSRPSIRAALYLLATGLGLGRAAIMLRGKLKVW